MKSSLIIALQDIERIVMNCSPYIVPTSLNMRWILIYMSHNILPWSSTYGSACTINDSRSWCYKDSQIIALQTLRVLLGIFSIHCTHFFISFTLSYMSKSSFSWCTINESCWWCHKTYISSSSSLTMTSYPFNILNFLNSNSSIISTNFTYRMFWGQIYS